MSRLGNKFIRCYNFHFSALFGSSSLNNRNSVSTTPLPAANNNSFGTQSSLRPSLPTTNSTVSGAVAQKTSVPTPIPSVAMHSNSVPMKSTPVQNMKTPAAPSLPQYLPQPTGTPAPAALAANSQYYNSSSPSSVIPSHLDNSKKATKRKNEIENLPILAGTSTDSFGANLDEVKPMKMPTRRESTRPVKKPFKDAPGPSSLKSRKGKKSERMKYCASILKELLSKRHYSYAWPFYVPVDAEGLGLDDYYDLIKHPMDLGTVKQNMDQNKYRKPDDFAADIRLIFTNCYKYNPSDHEVVGMGRKLQDIFEMKYAKMPESNNNSDDQGESSSANSGSDYDSSDESESDDDEYNRTLQALQDQLKEINAKIESLTRNKRNKAKKRKSRKSRLRDSKNVSRQRVGASGDLSNNVVGLPSHLTQNDMAISGMSLFRFVFVLFIFLFLKQVTTVLQRNRETALTKLQIKSLPKQILWEILV